MVIVRTAGHGTLAQEVIAEAAGPHSFMSDEPPSLGGSGSGPSPFDLLAASLGSCAGITLRLYADRKGWPLEGAEIKVRMESKEEMRMEIELFGPLTAQQRDRLLEIASRCPVHRMLSRGIRIVDRPGNPGRAEPPAA